MKTPKRQNEPSIWRGRAVNQEPSDYRQEYARLPFADVFMWEGIARAMPDVGPVRDVQSEMEWLLCNVDCWGECYHSLAVEVERHGLEQGVQRVVGESLDEARRQGFAGFTFEGFRLAYLVAIAHAQWEEINLLRSMGELQMQIAHLIDNDEERPTK